MSGERPSSDPGGQVERDPRPVVALPRPAVPATIIVTMSAAAVLALFATLDAKRRHSAISADAGLATGGDAFQAPPALHVPPLSYVEPAPMAEIPVVPRVAEAVPWPANPYPRLLRSAPPAPLPPIASAPDTVPSGVRVTGQASLEAPAIIFDNGPVEAEKGTVQASAKSVDDPPAQTSMIGNQTSMIIAGTMIPAVLETPIDSARPGLVRAVVSIDVKGFDSRKVLVPKGSRLLGEYQSDIRSGQNRVLVNWTRLIRSDGVAIRIGSPAADDLGGAGVPGQVNTFFFRRFASAVLQSALSVGVNLASRPGNGSVIIGLPANAAGAVGQSLLPPNDLQPKITVKEGALLNVFVAHDLDFSGAPLPAPFRRR